MTGWELYWLLMLDKISSLLNTLTGTGIFITVVMGWVLFISIVDKKTEDIKLTKSIALIFFPLWFFCILTNTLLPSTKQMAAILVVPQILSNEKVQQLPDEIMNLLGMSIDKAKETLKKEVIK